MRDLDIEGRATPIVACTANVFPAQVTALRQSGVDAYLRKPLRRMELSATVNRVLATGSSQPGGERPPYGPEPEPDTAEGLLRIVSLLGAKRVIAALDRLTEELGALTLVAPSDSASRQKLAEQVHAIISTASMLELRELAEGCRDLENACREAVGMEAALARLGPAVGSALRESGRLRTGLESLAA
ncbi:MAG: hypothetical protein AVDCRST_MAG90-2606 [uncultured Microvirga sp.]|uniref:Response regulatory domain-containing protein n=1 Tax=uncultured Microvirga sp. TaxID=412392 RepID=A0A6J4MAR7_9HYPH|nr:MAG: hypothetical protein AVDCRST_MAG90-2606 [uncultured Microvirga sp.]